MNPSIQTNYLESMRTLFRYYKQLGEKAMAQVDDKAINQKYSEDGNSISILVKHLSGNMISRFTDFLTEDGEKPWRNRDDEFEGGFESRAALQAAWEKGWKTLLDTLDRLTEDDLLKIIYIRNEGHTVLEALNRQLAHYAYHVGQMVLLARMYAAGEWDSLSIPRGKSKDFNKDKFSAGKGRRHFV